MGARARSPSTRSKNFYYDFKRPRGGGGGVASSRLAQGVVVYNLLTSIYYYGRRVKGSPLHFRNKKKFPLVKGRREVVDIGARTPVPSTAENPFPVALSTYNTIQTLPPFT